MFKTRKLLAFISMILAVLFLIEVPVSAVAPVLSTELVSENLTLEDIDEEKVEPESVIVSELESERTENSKTFRLSDGTCMIAQYNMPVHYKDDNGKWTDYDNSLSVTEQEVSVLETQPAVLDEATADSVAVASIVEEPEITLNRRTEKKQMFKNHKSDTGISFSKEAASDNMVLVEKGDHAVSWGYHDINVKSAKQKNEKKIRTGNDRFTVLDNLTGTVVYESAYDGVDIECITTPVGVKENIILNKKSATNKFVSTYDIGELRAEKLNDREIALFNSSNEIEYYINALYMFDANNETSDSIALNIIENSNGKLVVELIADEQWLNAKERVYPVTIDPTLLYGQEWGNVQCTFVDSENPTTAYGYGSATGYTGTIYTGKWGTAEYLSLMKINQLPTLNKGDMIVGATVNLLAYNTTFPLVDHIGVYQITEDWSQENVTWNEKPEYSNVLIDYFKTSDLASYNYWYKWDITKLVKKWYNKISDTQNVLDEDSKAENYGFYLKMINDNTTQNAGFYSSNYPSYTDIRPVFQLSYRNNKGIESYWDYTSVNVGNVGTAYINDYSGALMFELPVATTADPVLPASISYVYNSYMAGEKYDKHAPYFGDGWRMNMQQTVLPSTEFGLTGDNATNYPYVYTDADGTEHYFKKTYEYGVAKYYDEDGLKLELTVGSDGGEKFKITDENKNKLYFHTKGFLNRFEDAYGNIQKVNYIANSIDIDYISDTTENRINIIRDSNGYVTDIIDPDGKTTHFEYDSNNNLSLIKYPDNRRAIFGYNNGMLNLIRDSDGYEITLEYSNDDTKSVKKVQEGVMQKGVYTGGQRIIFERSNLNETKITTNGIDGIKDNSDDCITTYQYDNWGRTISTQTSIKDGSELGASSATYTSGTNVKTMNKVTNAHFSGANTVNLLRNSNLEGISNWTGGTWSGTTTTTVAENSTTRYYGQKSLCLENTACSDGGAGSIYQNVDNLSGDTTYTLSGYVKVESVTAKSTENFGAIVGVTIQNSNGTSTSHKSEYISEVTDTSINDGWRRVSVKFTTPENVSQVRVHLGLESATGKVYFDGAQLEKSENASSYNFVQNSSMELYTDNKPDNWSNFSNITFTGNDGCVSTESQHGSSSFKIMGDVTKNKILCQEIPVSGVEEDTYILSAWAKTPTAVPIKDDIKFKITIQVHYSDGTYIIKDTPSFNTAVTSWQYLSTAFNLSDKTDTVKTPTKVKIFPNYSRQGNEVYFDNFQLIKEPAQSYTYDDEGNMVSVVENAKQNSTLEYNANNKLTEYVDPKGNKYEYTYYDNTARLKTAKTQRGATYTYTYDSRGSVSTVIGKTDDRLIRASQTITYPSSTSAEYSVKTSDALNHEVTSIYNAKNGTLKSVTDANGTVSYTYNENNDTLTSVSQGGSTVSYTYDEASKYLESITSGTSNYYFDYDAFGNRTETRVGDTTLATYTYGANNGPLQRMDYGNGDYVTYTYDKYGNEKEKWVNGTKVYEGISDNTGTITKAIDDKNHLQYNYTYDSTGRLINSTRTNTTNNSRVAMFEYDFDLNNNLTKFAILTPNGKNATNYEYGLDNQPEKVTFSNSNTLTYKYDSIGRNYKITINTNNTENPIITNYTYWAKTIGNETYRSNLLHTEKSEHFKYRYTYDARNNLTKIEQGAGEDDNNLTYTTLEEYTYDYLDQLKQVDYLSQNKRVKYTYDNGGNIESEEIYNISGDTEILEEINTYTYYKSDSNSEDVWGDLLTCYSNKKISNQEIINYEIEYDDIGNPTKYRDGFKFNWSNGRQLDSYEKDGETVNYTYDANGMRLTKTVDGVKHTYLYNDGLLVQETRGSKIFDYSYDANGNIRMLKYTANPNVTPVYYYYALNSRGDVIGLYDSNGNLIAKYTYDAWGNGVSVTYQSGNEITHDTHIAKMQPFRYRSYYYDTDSGLYYLQSRYYDPVTHRFINADACYDTGTGVLGYNMYTYCDNNPVNCSDPSGSYPTRDREMQVEIASGTSKYNIMDVTRLQMFNNRTGATCTSNTQSIGVTVAYGSIKDFEYKGWKYAIHEGKASENSKEHIHIYKNGKHYEQNFDGTTSHGCKGSPPNSVKKKLKEEGIWDWDGNAMKQEPEYLMMYVPEGEMSIHLMNPSMHNVYFLPSGLTMPTVPFCFAPTTTFTFVPAFIF